MLYTSEMDSKPISLTQTPLESYSGPEPQPFLLVGDLPAPPSEWSGWGNYVDDQYTALAPLQLVADTPTLLDNNAAGSLTNETQLPADITSFYDSTTFGILGLDGDAYSITLDFKVKPTEGGATYIEHWIDIGAPVGELYRRITSFPKGINQERDVTTTTSVYTLATWEANGGKVYVQSNGTCDIYDIRFVVFRLHKAL